MNESYPSELPFVFILEEQNWQNLFIQLVYLQQENGYVQSQN